MTGIFHRSILGLFLLSILLTSMQEIRCQEFVVDDASSIGISGTSTLHDWEMTATQFAGTCRMSASANEFSVQELQFEVAAIGLTAEKAGMQRDAHKALEAEAFPKIRFVQTEGSRSEAAVENDETRQIRISGLLSIRGEEQRIEIPVNAGQGKDGIQMDGTFSLDMTAFGIEPPKALLGLIRTGEEVQIDFKLIWTSK